MLTVKYAEKKNIFLIFNLAEGIALAKELNVEQAYFTHMSHQMGLHDEISAELPPEYI